MPAPTPARRAAATAARAFVVSLALAGAAQATPITMTFFSTDSDFGASGGADFRLVLTGDTANFQPGANPFGGGLYSGLSGRVTSATAGYSDVPLDNPLSVYVGLPNLGLPDIVAFVDGNGNLLGVNDAPWSGVTDIAWSGLSSASTNTVRLDFLGLPHFISTLDFPDGRNDAGFTAVLRTSSTNDVPEPAPLMLVGLALAGLALQRARKAA